MRKLRTGAMPPAGMPRPDEAAYDALASSLERALDCGAVAARRRAGAAPPEPHGVRQRRARPPGARGRRRDAPAARRHRRRLRQQRRRYWGSPPRSSSGISRRRQRLAPWRSATRRSSARALRPTWCAATHRRRRTWRGCRSARAAASWRATRSRWTASTCSRRACSRPTSAPSVASSSRTTSSSRSTGVACSWRPSAGTRTTPGSAANTADIIAALDTRLTTRVTVTAGPHVVGASFLSRTAAQGGSKLQPFLRTTLDAGDHSGCLTSPASRSPARSTRPDPATRRAGSESSPAGLVARPTNRAARGRFSPRWPTADTGARPRAPRSIVCSRSIAPGGSRDPSRPASSSGCAASWPIPSSCFAPRGQIARTSSHRRLRPGVTAVFLPVEQHPGRRAARPGGEAASCTPAPCWSGRCAACWPIPGREALVEQLRRPVAAAAEPAKLGARQGGVPGLRRQPPAVVPARDGAARRQHHARGPQRARAADRRLHVRRRAAGQALRHPGRLRQPLPPRRASGDRSARGLLGHGSILTVTSHADRTSPVVRGKWILENLLGTPPPPPPPNVPPLDEGEGVAPRTMRERMEQHRRNPACASCHKIMDPIGLALENFDAVGAWRTTDACVSDRRHGTAGRRQPRRRPRLAARGAAEAPRRVRRQLDGEAADLRAGAARGVPDMPDVRADRPPGRPGASIGGRRSCSASSRARRFR